MTGPSLLIVDAANVVGSVPDGWWRDRRGAAERLRDRLADLHTTGLDAIAAPVEVWLVVEGQARGIASSPTVTVISAPGSGDDEIVRIVADNPDRQLVVVTADRELRRRVTDLGARCQGPRLITDR